jgi:two-component system sensor histidine kinase/response regulator
MDSSLVLVVDDDEDIRRLLRARLEPEYEVAEAADAAAALEVVQQRHVDLVLLDVMMPGVDGLETCRRIKAAAQSADWLPVLMLTALTDASSRTAGLEAGADDYLSKPIDAVQLKLRVKHHLHRSQQQRIIRRQLEELERVAALRADLTALMVHDLRNPLTAVMASMELVLPLLKGDDNALLARGLDAAGNIKSSLEDILSVHLIEERAMPLQTEQLDPSQLVAAVVANVAPAAQRQGVTVAFEQRPGLTLTADPKLLSRAIENLLANAIRHTQAGVEVSVQAAPGRVVIGIADSGTGVPEDLKEGLFEKFGSPQLRQQNARRGYGLGLYMVKLVTHAHGGSIEIDDREGGGAVFRLVLPA